MMSDRSLRCEVEKSKDKDRYGNEVVTVRCRGSLVGDTSGVIKDAVKPLIPLGGRIIIDLSNVDYMDSSGLGTLVGLKASALHQGLCILELINITPRVLELLRLTNLTQLFTS